MRAARLLVRPAVLRHRVPTPVVRPVCVEAGRCCASEIPVEVACAEQTAVDFRQRSAVDGR
eukprot:9929409-Alexandrium_andersonii.AAC.1